jgi:hypothetical protein
MTSWLLPKRSVISSESDYNASESAVGLFRAQVYFRKHLAALTLVTQSIFNPFSQWPFPGFAKHPMYYYWQYWKRRNNSHDTFVPSSLPFWYGSSLRPDSFFPASRYTTNTLTSSRCSLWQSSSGFYMYPYTRFDGEVEHRNIPSPSAHHLTDTTVKKRRYSHQGWSSIMSKNDGRDTEWKSHSWSGGSLGQIDRRRCLLCGDRCFAFLPTGYHHRGQLSRP